MTTSALRSIRLLRIARVLRLIKFFRELHLLVVGISRAGKALLWIGLVIFMLVSVSSIYITKIVGQNEKVRQRIELSAREASGCCGQLKTRGRKFYRARSRLYRSRLLRVNFRWKALASFAQLSVSLRRYTSRCAKIKPSRLRGGAAVRPRGALRRRHLRPLHRGR